MQPLPLKQVAIRFWSVASPNACRIGEGFLQQQWNVQRDDFGVDAPESRHQALIEEAAQLRDTRPAADCR